MKLKINNELLDYTILAMMFLQLVILGFFGLTNILEKIITLMILARMIFYYGKISIRMILILTVMLICFSLSIAFSESGTFEILKSNFLMMFYPAVYAYYFYYLSCNNSKLMDKVTNALFIPANLVLILNIVVMIIQIVKPYSINAVITSNEISYYEDTVSGMFSYATTNVVCLYSIFIILYNFAYIKEIKNRKYKIFMNIYNYLLIGITLIISLFNENKAVFLMLPIFIFAYLFYVNKRIKKERLKPLLLSLFAFIGIVLMYFLLNPFKNFIDNNILQQVLFSKDSLFIGNNANGSGERFSIIIFALKRPLTWLFGDGIMSAGLYQENYLGFRHFGIADFGSILVLGGIWLLISIIVYYTTILKRIINDRNNSYITIIVVGLYTLCILYTQCITRIEAVMCLFLIALAFRKKYMNMKMTS